MCFCIFKYFCLCHRLVNFVPILILRSCFCACFSSLFSFFIDKPSFIASGGKLSFASVYNITSAIEFAGKSFCIS